MMTAADDENLSLSDRQQAAGHKVGFVYAKLFICLQYFISGFILQCELKEKCSLLSHTNQ